MFDDGIMSAIDFVLDVQKQGLPAGINENALSRSSVDHC
jgi:cyanate lyase